MHVNVIKAYAHMGFDTAQHELGNRYLHGIKKKHVKNFLENKKYLFQINKKKNKKELELKDTKEWQWNGLKKQLIKVTHIPRII